MQKKLDKMAEVKEILDSLHSFIDDTLYEDIETGPDKDHLQKTALQLVEEALHGYKDILGG